MLGGGGGGCQGGCKLKIEELKFLCKWVGGSGWVGSGGRVRVDMSIELKGGREDPLGGRGGVRSSRGLGVEGCGLVEGEGVGW